jgi:branched-subunit amino acid ABC-type transport system permease component
LLYAIFTFPFLNFLAPIFSKDIIAIVILTIALFYKPTGLFTKKVEARP